MKNEDERMARPLIRVRDLEVSYKLGRERVGWTYPQRLLRAVDGVTLDIKVGATLGLIGESGSGKSTLGRSIMLLEKPTDGSVYLQDRDIALMDRHEKAAFRRTTQMIFQSPYSAMNRRMTVGEIVAEPLTVHGVARSVRTSRAGEVLDMVGLSSRYRLRYPHEVSGGQLQRVAIARALVMSPELIVADEPTASLDASVRAQIVNLLQDLKADLGLTVLFISHDLSVVSYVADRIGVMYLGRLVEIGPRESLERTPLHPYTQALLTSVPNPIPGARKKRALAQGEIPSPVDPPSGCSYHPRCPIAMEICRVTRPKFELKASGHWVACHAVEGMNAADTDLAAPAEIPF